MRAAIVSLLLAAQGLPAGAQLLDTTVGDLVENQINRQVVDDIAEQLETVVQQHVESDVAAAVEQQVQSDVADAVERQVAAQVAATVEQAVETEIVDTVRQQVEAGVVDALEQQIESVVTDSIGNTVGDAVSQTVEDAIGDALDGAAVIGAALGGAGDAAGQALGQNGDAESADAQQSARTAFAAGVDASGRAIEGATWVILVPAEFAARIASWGFTIRERRDLATLERVLLRVDAPEDRDIAQAALELALDAPGTVVDFNHLYRAGAEQTAAGRADSHTAAAVTLAPVSSPAGIALGLIDSAVAADHEALRAANIVQRDFVPFAGERPLDHGTAVASIVVGESKLHGRLPGARLYAASVFFADDAGQPAAATASLVAALEWLAANGVRTVNMSLAGPPNRVLEGAVDEAAARGMVVVAAVGNNGPAAEPLYPAAYDSVVGVTAVDSDNRIYRYANRGRQVTFAAPGVRIKVARSAGGYANDSGTSLAAPYAAAVIAAALAVGDGQPSGAVLAALEAAAIDLGEKNFDDVFGYGLIAAPD